MHAQITRKTCCPNHSKHAQNAKSIAYLGFAVGTEVSASITSVSQPDHNLHKLFRLDPVALEDMWSTLELGQVRCCAPVLLLDIGGDIGVNI